MGNETGIDIARIRTGDFQAIADAIESMRRIRAEQDREAERDAHKRPITPPFDATQFNAQPPLVWTVGSLTNRPTFSYLVRNGVMDLWVEVTSTTTSGSAAPYLVIGIPPGWICIEASIASCRVSIGGIEMPSWAYVLKESTAILLQRQSAVNYTTGAATVNVNLTHRFAVRRT